MVGFLGESQQVCFKSVYYIYLGVHRQMMAAMMQIEHMCVHPVTLLPQITTGRRLASWSRIIKWLRKPLYLAWKSHICNVSTLPCFISNVSIMFIVNYSKFFRHLLSIKFHVQWRTVLYHAVVMNSMCFRPTRLNRWQIKLRSFIPGLLLPLTKYWACRWRTTIKRSHFQHFWKEAVRS